ncbi:aspartate-semialdehyde dehydrogenase [Marinobacterium nitratireducens]|uniref:Aspartate-semialdehyde dehydrogenase n=1 Tax=Marinobacterium nitratireducens TaxID=518897 RepID=A0A917Z6E3_9GAMM|nr:aspartate-semialdehyde dehydrogenase [Marinobacterium nitratireducens]GGO76044.1 aspartate-semialdehyde dehydrogenase [Marinobacterium nitratireducens]
MTQTYNVAVVGATGLVGEAIVELLESRDFPVGELFVLASNESAGKPVYFKGRSIKVGDLADFDFSQVQIALFSAGSAVAAEYAPRAVDAGCVVIDNSSCFRNEPEVPLVVPEVNPERVREHCGIIANPNCSTIQMLVALAPIYRYAGIRRINVATYQAVSGAGRQAVEELARQTALLLNARDVDNQHFAKQMAFNVLPQIDSLDDSGYSGEELKMVWETRKILEDDEIAVTPTCVRVPVFFGHSEAVHLETRDPISALEVRELLQQAPGIEVLDEAQDGGWATPVTEAAGKDAVFVSRIREDITAENGINLWVVSDNVRKGAALNAVQIAELLIREPF